MPRYSYKAKSHSGESTQGHVDARDRRSALTQIERMGFIPVSVVEGAGVPPKEERRKPLRRSAGNRHSYRTTRAPRKQRMKLRDVLFFTRELSDLLASGMTLGNALNTLAVRKTGRAQDVIIPQIHDEIIQGYSLSDALARRPESFSTLYINMVRAGEAGGDLSEVLERLCQHYERVQEAREKIGMALIYPCIVMGMGALIIMFTMIYVIPQFTSIFEELGSTLPVPTQILIGISGFFMDYWWLMVAAAALAAIAVHRYLGTEEGKIRWHRMQLRIPVVRDIVTANAYAHFARTLSALLSNGVPVLDALEIVEKTVGNRIIAMEIREARNRVTDGATISAPLASGKVFPRLLTDMLAVGEETGDMGGALNHIGNRYEHELDRNIKIMTTVLEPAMIIVIFVVVGFVAISMLMAVFDLTSGLNI